MGEHVTRVAFEAILLEPGEGGNELRGKTPQLASGSHRELRLQPASMVGEIDHPGGTVMPADMKGDAAPVVEMAYLRFRIAKPTGERARVGAADSCRIETQRTIDMLAQPRNPPRMVNKNIGVRGGVPKVVGMTDFAQ